MSRNKYIIFEKKYFGANQGQIKGKSRANQHHYISDVHGLHFLARANQGQIKGKSRANTTLQYSNCGERELPIINIIIINKF